MTWPTKNLRELINKYFSGTWGDEPKDGGNARVIRVSDIKPDYSIDYENVPIRRLKEKDLEKYRLQIGDIVVVKSSGNQTKIISGRAALFEYKGKEAYVPSNFLIALRPNHNLIIPMWLWVNLNSKAAKRFIELIIGATTYPNLKPADYLNLKIPVPPLPIQQKIVERLDAIRKAQELNDKQIELAEELFQSLLHRELDPKGKKWEVRKIKECLRSCQYGISLKMNSQRIGYPILRINNLYNGEIDTSDIKYVEINREEFEKYKLEKGDILFNRVNSYDLVGKTSIFNLEDNYVFASYLIRLKTNSKLLLGEFLNYFLNSNPGQRAIKSKARRAVSQANVNARELESIKIPLPPLETQQKIVEKLSAVQEYKKKLLERKQKLQELFESVLDKSFKGELAE